MTAVGIVQQRVLLAVAGNGQKGDPVLVRLVGKKVYDGIIGKLILRIVMNNPEPVGAAQVQRQQNPKQNPAPFGARPSELPAENQREQAHGQNQQQNEPDDRLQTELGNTRRVNGGNTHRLEIRPAFGAFGGIDEQTQQADNDGGKTGVHPFAVKRGRARAPFFKLRKQAVHARDRILAVSQRHPMDAITKNEDQRPGENVHELDRILNRGSIRQRIEQLVMGCELPELKQESKDHYRKPYAYGTPLNL